MDVILLCLLIRVELVDFRNIAMLWQSWLLKSPSESMKQLSASALPCGRRILCLFSMSALVCTGMFAARKFLLLVVVDHLSALDS